MKRIALCLLLLIPLAVSAHAVVFRTTMTPSGRSTAGGGAVLTVDLIARSWSLAGEISNLVFSASRAGIVGPTQRGQPTPPWTALGHESDLKGELTGGGVFTEEELDWLQRGLLQVRVFTDQNEFPEGELSGVLAVVPEPEAFALVGALSLGAYAGYRRRTLKARSSSKAGLLTVNAPEVGLASSRLSTAPVRGFSHSST